MSYNTTRISRRRDRSYVRKKSAWDFTMDPDHFRMMLKHIKQFPANKNLKERDYMLFMLMGNLGLRSGEAAMLQVDNFSRITANIPVATVPSLKGKKKTKDIYLHQKVADRIYRHIDRYVYTNQKYIFTGGSGDGYISTRHIRTIFYHYCRECGFTEKYSPHCLRHMYGTLLFSRTQDFAFLRDQMGHAKIAQVSGSTDRYIHLSKDRIMGNVKKTGYIL